MKKSILALLHIGYWALYLVLLGLILFCIRMGTDMSKPIPTSLLAVFGLTIIPAALGFYAFYTLLFNRFLNKKKIVLLFVVGILTAFLCGFVGAVCMDVLSYFDIGFNVSIFKDGFNSASAITILLSIIAVLNGGMGLIIRGFVAWFEGIKTKEALAKKNFETELALIKSQLDPHFLFNTLNNIDILIEKDAAKASAYLKKLSDIMRFMLYETKTERIPLSKELAYIEKYIELQRIRTTNPNAIQFAVEGDTEGVQIAPMVFIPFVENAFKHTESIKMDNTISIKITVNDGKVSFECQNHFRSLALSDQGFSGLGNDLIQKRLTLLYPNRHTLKTSQHNAQYTVTLNIQ